MGTDIHVSIEKKDKHGKWWTIWNSHLFHTNWFSNKTDYKPESSCLVKLASRNYSLFAALGSLRGFNEFEMIKKQDFGVANPGLPDDASKYTLYSLKDSDIHSTGYLSLKELRKINKEIDTIYNTTKTEKPNEIALLEPQYKALKFWIQTIEESVELLVKENLFGTFLSYTPDTNNEDFYIDPNLPVFAGETNHEKLEIRKLWDNVVNEDDIRVIFGFDN